MNKLFKFLSLCLLFVVLISLTSCKYIEELLKPDDPKPLRFTLNCELDGESHYETITNCFGNVSNTMEPGSSGTFEFEFVFVWGTPNVSYKLMFDVTEEKRDTKFYAYANVEWKLDDGEWCQMWELLNEVQGLNHIFGENTYEAGEVPALFGVHTISYRWNPSDKDAEALKDLTVDPFNSFNFIFYYKATQLD